MADSFERVVVAYGISRYMKSENDAFKKVKNIYHFGKEPISYWLYKPRDQEG